MKNISKRLIFSCFIVFIIGTYFGFAQTNTETIDTLIEQKRDFNKNNKSSTVFMVQIYNGNEDESYKMERNFRLEFPDYNVKVVYNKPEFKTQVGYFKTRLEADRALNIIKEKFLGSIVLEDKI